MLSVFDRRIAQFSWLFCLLGWIGRRCQINFMCFRWPFWCRALQNQLDFAVGQVGIPKVIDKSLQIILLAFFTADRAWTNHL